MSSVSGFTFKYDSVQGISATEGFKLIVNNAVLPVDLIDFTAQVTGENRVELNWQTASEYNNDYFNIERSASGEAWKTIGRVKGKGNSSQIVRYTAIDSHPPAGTVIYRLRQIDYNGTGELFGRYAVVELSGSPSEYPYIETYPNPFNESFSILLSGEKSRLYPIIVYNYLGQPVNKIWLRSGLFHPINLSGFPAGLYFVAVEGAKGPHQKVVKK